MQQAAGQAGAAGEAGEGGEGLLLASGEDALNVYLAEAFDVVEAEADGCGAVGAAVFERALGLAVVDVDGEHGVSFALDFVDQFASVKQLASWACLCPGNDISANRRRSGRRRQGQQWLVKALVEAAWAASRTKESYLAAQFHRLRVRRGAKRAAVAVAHSILTIIFHLLKDLEAQFREVGGDYFLKRNKENHEWQAVKTLQALGYEVWLTPVVV